MYSMTLETVGNPDFGQYAPISPVEEISAGTWKTLLAKMEAYIGKYDVGGGNWVDPALMRSGKLVGFVSYNGRIWETRHHTAKEIIIR